MHFLFRLAAIFVMLVALMEWAFWPLTLPTTIVSSLGALPPEH